MPVLLRTCTVCCQHLCLLSIFTTDKCDVSVVMVHNFACCNMIMHHLAIKFVFLSVSGLLVYIPSGSQFHLLIKHQSFAQGNINTTYYAA